MKGFFKNGCPIIELFVEGEKIEAEIDTGFSGSIMLSRRLIRKFDLQFYWIDEYIDANGERVLTQIYKGKIKFLGEQKEVEILSTDADFCLAGMDLFDNCKIIIERSKDLVEITKTTLL